MGLDHYGRQTIIHNRECCIADASNVFVSPISFYEVSQKVRLKTWPEMTPFVGHLMGPLDEQNSESAVLDDASCLAAGRLDQSHRDPFDRMRAATARHYDIPLIAADSVFGGIVQRIW